MIHYEWAHLNSSEELGARVATSEFPSFRIEKLNGWSKGQNTLPSSQ